MPSVTGLGALLLTALACCVGILAQQPDTPTTTLNVTTNTTINTTLWRTVTLNATYASRPVAPTLLPVAPYPRPATPTPRPAVLTTSAPRGGAPGARPGGHSTSSESSKEIQQAASSDSSEEIHQAAPPPVAPRARLAPTEPAPVTPSPALRAAPTGSIVWVNQALPGPNIEVGLNKNGAAGIHLPRKGSQSSQGEGASSSASGVGVGVAVAVVAAIVVGSVIFVIKKYRHNSPALVEA
ncbi:proline-rich receptor-like protein kinase PERK1 [Strongylocentrotus purpuratus]|uniref:Uncharacterized protein n=1 Tax=Strongylocentrotus purpuratus TaxID=7668 RepID=A0A7M7N9B0_STRPU|nr:proline-rich receptor-like protein kinase PERK1 [Strongylocentrotus purpuratus]